MGQVFSTFPLDRPFPPPEAFYPEEVPPVFNDSDVPKSGAKKKRKKRKKGVTQWLLEDLVTPLTIRSAGAEDVTFKAL